MNDRITALEERVAFAMWKAEADRAAPNVGRNRTAAMFAVASDDERARWLSLARAALAASRDADPVTVAQVRTARWCDPCRSVGMIHCSDPEHCGFMRTCGQEADEWKSWLDDLPLHEDFSTGINRLQDFITRIVAALDLTPAPAVEPVELTAQDAARVPEIAGQIREITEADMANIVAHLSYECEPTGPLPNANSLMMEVVRLRNKLAAIRDLGGDA